MVLTCLPKSTIRLITSSQVITSVTSVVKELMENSFDAGASNIEIRLEKHGLDKIEVRDDGSGITADDCLSMALPHYTSKITDFSDLNSIQSYGFRGEALYSLCSLANVAVTTRMADDEIARSYVFDHSGKVIESKISHGLKGTTITVTGLFKNVPVRRQVISNGKRVGDELKKVENMVKSLAVIHPLVRVTLAHNKFLIFQKTSVAHLKLSVMQILNHSVTKQLQHLVGNTDKIKLELLIPKKDCDIQVVSIGQLVDSFRLFINKRPVRDKKVEKIFSDVFFSYFGHFMPPNKFPVCFVSIEIQPDMLDVNLEPNKTKVFIKDQDDVLEYIKDKLSTYYCDTFEDNKQDKINTNYLKKRKADSFSPKEVTTHKSPVKILKSDDMVEIPKSNINEDLGEPNNTIFNNASRSNQDSANIKVVNTIFESKSHNNSFNYLIPSNKEEFGNKLDTTTVSEINKNNNKVVNRLRGSSGNCENRLNIFFKKNNSNNNMDNCLFGSNDNIFNKIEFLDSEVTDYAKNNDSGFNGCENIKTSEIEISNKNNFSPLNLFENSSDSIHMNINPENINKYSLSNSEQSDLNCQTNSTSSSIFDPDSNINNVINNNGMDGGDISLSQWSRGTIKINENKVQGSIILVNPKRVPYNKEKTTSNGYLKAVAKENESPSKNSIKLINDIGKFLESDEGEFLLKKVTSDHFSGDVSRKHVVNEANRSPTKCENSSINLSNLPASATDVSNKQYDPNISNDLLEIQSSVSKNTEKKSTSFIDFDKIKVSKNEDRLTEEHNIKNWQPGKSKTTENISSIIKKNNNNEMSKIEMSAFSRFASEMRSEILKETPGMCFTTITRLLNSKWRNLQKEEKEKYEERMNESHKKKDNIKSTNVVVNNKLSKSSTLSQKMDVSSERSIKTPKIPIRNKIKVDFDSIEFGKYISPLKNPLVNNEFHIIGQIGSSDLWIYKQLLTKETSEICVISTIRLQESFLFNQNMENMSIPIKNLEESIKFTPSDIGVDLWNLLMKMESSFDEEPNWRVITDKRIIMNGFRINIDESNDGGTIAFLTDIAMHINFYGISDLKKTLEQIKIRGDNCSIAESRCPNATKYVRSETIRQFSVSSLSSLDETELQKLINLWWAARHYSSKCPHGKEVVLSLQTIMY